MVKCSFVTTSTRVAKWSVPSFSLSLRLHTTQQLIPTRALFPLASLSRALLQAIKAVRRKNPKIDRMNMFRRKNLPHSPHTPVTDNLGSTEHKIRKEIAIMKKCHHPHVVQLVEVIDDLLSEKIYMGAFLFLSTRNHHTTPTTRHIRHILSLHFPFLHLSFHFPPFVLTHLRARVLFIAVMEYLSGGEIKWRTPSEEPALRVDQTRRICRDVILGLQYRTYLHVISPRVSCSRSNADFTFLCLSLFSLLAPLLFLPQCIIRVSFIVISNPRTCCGPPIGTRSRLQTLGSRISRMHNR